MCLAPAICELLPKLEFFYQNKRICRSQIIYGFNLRRIEVALPAKLHRNLYREFTIAKIFLNDRWFLSCRVALDIVLSTFDCPRKVRMLFGDSESFNLKAMLSSN